ncbi:MAG TPA: hypothetical protein VGQ76_10515 [Thermoanaerobaculia bacterium]|nr:hypothetical protein [Thermoanaerobaculia bacterium]
MSEAPGNSTSERLYRLAAVVRADVLIRLRRPSTAVVFVLLSMLPYMWIPDPSTGRTLIQIAGRRALYNSAAIGMGTAVLATMFIGLAGFYVISNAVKRDVISRCGFVIASTTMRSSEYLLGKFAGNVVFLSIFTLGFMATAMAMVLVRGEAPLEPLVFARQYLLLLPPTIFAVSAFAIVFECTPVLRSKFGDVLYFFLWLGLMGVVASQTEKGTVGWPAYFDISGLAFMTEQLKTTYQTDTLSIGATDFDAKKAPLIFNGLQFGAQWMLPRVVSTLWPMVLLILARVFFHRFDPARVRSMPNEKSRTSWLGRFNLITKPVARLFVLIGNAITSLPGLPLIVRTAMTDAATTIAAFPLVSVAIAGFAIASLTTSDAQSHIAGLLPFAFAGCAIALADIACREKRAGTTALLYAAPGLRAKFVLWKFASTLLVAIAFLGVPIARAVALRPSSATPLLVAVVFLSAAATALGILSANPKTFIVSFLTFWYIALSDKGASPELDFAGWFGKTTSSVSLAYALAALAFLTLAQLFHMWELRRKW